MISSTNFVYDRYENIANVICMSNTRFHFHSMNKFSIGLLWLPLCYIGYEFVCAY